jgi:hypothetical protein
MIAVVNVGPYTEDSGGERNYELRINQRVLATFTHARRDGLAACLRAAAAAADTHEEKTRRAENNLLASLSHPQSKSQSHDLSGGVRQG